MPVLQVNEQRFSLSPGPTRLGGAGADVRVADDAPSGVAATIEVAPDGNAVIQRAGTLVVKINGVALGAEPTPLIHGDKLEVAGRELRFEEDAKGGATQFVSGDDVAAMAKRRASALPTASTGGRLVSLVDGKEYQIPAEGITIGRDAASGVVVAQHEVSRFHAEIVPASSGYLLKDHSTNGVYVNGARISESRLLARSDVVRVGSEEFRFYADIAKPAPAAEAHPVAVSTAPAAPVVDAPAAPSTKGEPAVVAALETTAKGTRAGASTSAERASRIREQRVEPAAPPARSGTPVWIRILLALAVAAGAYFLLAR